MSEFLNKIRQEQPNRNLPVCPISDYAETIAEWITAKRDEGRFRRRIFARISRQRSTR